MFHCLKFSCCRMDQYEEHLQEVPEDEVEVGQQKEMVGIVAPQLMNIPLEVQVVHADNPESPSPSPACPSPVLGSSPQQPGDAPSFVGIFTSDDLIELKQWAVDAQSLRGTPDLRLEDPEISPTLKTFLRYIWGLQWEHKFIQPSGRSSFVN